MVILSNIFSIPRFTRVGRLIPVAVAAAAFASAALAEPNKAIPHLASADFGWQSNVADWREQNKSFEDIAVFDPTVVTLTGAAEPEQVMSVRASWNDART